MTGGATMSEPPTDGEELLKKRRLTDERLLTEPADLRKMKPKYPDGEATILQEAYKKHAVELANIEDRQHKLSLLMLGIFSAGATLIASGHIELSPSLKWALTFLSLAIV